MKLEFEDLKFSDKDDKIRVTFLNIYYFYLDKKDLEKLGKVSVEDGSLMIDSSKKDSNVINRFNYLLEKGFSHMKSTINGKPALYIHKNSGIPLIGSNEFGIIDRGTTTIEIKPLTTCNIDCIFCSVDHLKRGRDFVVETDYLVDELKKVIAIKDKKVSIHIGSQGDSSLYANLTDLVRKVRALDVDAISIVTNGIAISKSRADELIEAGMSHFHISLHATKKERASFLANAPYPVDKVMDLCKHIANRANLLIVPVWVQGVNDEDIEDVIRFAKSIDANLGIQNFLEYKYGKKPGKMVGMDEFYEKLNLFEKKYDVDLTSLKGDLKIYPDNELKKPFRKGDIVDVKIMAQDRLKNTMVGVSGNRVVTVINYDRWDPVKVKIVRDKHNVFIGVPA